MLGYDPLMALRQAIGPVLALTVKQERALAVCRYGTVQNPDGVQ